MNPKSTRTALATITFNPNAIRIDQYYRDLDRNYNSKVHSSPRFNPGNSSSHSSLLKPRIRWASAAASSASGTIAKVNLIRLLETRSGCPDKRGAGRAISRSGEVSNEWYMTHEHDANHALSRLFQLVNRAVVKISVIFQDPRGTGGRDWSEHRLLFSFFLSLNRNGARAAGLTRRSRSGDGGGGDFGAIAEESIG